MYSRESFQSKYKMKEHEITLSTDEREVKKVNKQFCLYRFQ